MVGASYKTNKIGAALKSVLSLFFGVVGIRFGSSKNEFGTCLDLFTPLTFWLFYNL